MILKLDLKIECLYIYLDFCIRLLASSEFNLGTTKFYKTFCDFKIAIEVFFKERLKIPFMQEKLRRFASDNFHIRHRELCYLPSPYESFRFNFFGR